mmetsp:Transcript_6814/g.10677  ORF Transcript_6814/g.10677 Transcript_6814/m.10677 type:complete len:105 (-) Transcript_6814:744-1058(-)
MPCKRYTSTLQVLQGSRSDSKGYCRQAILLYVLLQITFHDKKHGFIERIQKLAHPMIHYRIVKVFWNVQYCMSAMADSFKTMSQLMFLTKSFVYNAGHVIYQHP